MNAHVKKVVADALALPPIERAELIEYVFESFDKESRATIDNHWIQEAEDRVNAYEKGHLKAVAAEKVFKKAEKR